MFWKYITLLLALMLLSSFLLVQYQGVFSGQNLVNGIFYSVVTALIVGLFYDIGVRRDMAILLDEEREYVRQVVTDRLLAKVNFDQLANADAREVARRIAASDHMMTLVSESLLDDHGREFFHTVPG
jgi:hypothetical protein